MVFFLYHVYFIIWHKTNFNQIYFIECTWMHYICWVCIFIAMADEYRHFLPQCLYGRVMRNPNKNDCAKSLRVVLLYGEFDNVPEFSRLYTFSMLLAEQQPVGR